MTTESPQAASALTYDAGPASDARGERGLPSVSFSSEPLSADTEITGPITLVMWVSSDTDDMDLFAYLRKTLPDGTVQTATRGILKVSHRKLDPARSTPQRPYHSHDVEQKLRPGEIVKVEVEIWPTSMVYEKGLVSAWTCSRTTVSTTSRPITSATTRSIPAGARLVRAVADRAGARRRSRPERTRRATRPHEIAADSTWPGQQDSLALRLALCRICESFSFEFASSWHEVVMNKNTNRYRSIIYGFSGAAVGLASTAHAGDMLDQVTVTATRIESPIGDVPATVSVYSSERIDTLLAQDIKDLVRFEPGVSVRSSPARFTAAGASTGRDGNSGFNVRGLEGNRVLIQVDSVRTPDAYSFGAQSVGRGDYVDLGVLKSVEIVRGPASALYGSDGLAGSVSFITKDPADVLGTQRNGSLGVTAGYASADEQFSQGLVGAARFGALETLVAYSHRDGEGQDTRGTNDAANTDRTTPNPEDNRSNSVLAKAIYSINDANRVRLTFDHRDRDVDWTVLSAIAKPPLTATSTLGLTAWDEVDRDRVALGYEFTGDSNALRGVQVALYYQDTDTRQHSEEDRNTAPDRIRDATFDTVVRGANLQMTSGFATGAVEHELVYGFDYSTSGPRAYATARCHRSARTFRRMASRPPITYSPACSCRTRSASAAGRSFRRCAGTTTRSIRRTIRCSSPPFPPDRTIRT